MGKEPTIDLEGFKRDFEVDVSTGADVKRFQAMLLFYSGKADEKNGKKGNYDALEKEMSAGRFGKATRDAALKFAQDNDPDGLNKKEEDAGLFKFVALIKQLVTRDDRNEKNPDDNTGDHLPIREYRNDPPAVMDVMAMQAKTEFKVEYDKDKAAHPETYKDTTPGSYNAAMAAYVAKSFIGEHEEGGENRGAAVRKFCDGQEGIPWCGGFVNYVMKKTYGEDAKVYNTENPLSALSYKKYAEDTKDANGKSAFIDKDAIIASGGKALHSGDVIVFKRGKDGQGHVGIVTGIDDKGLVHYVAGNCRDAVCESTINLNDPQQTRNLLGVADTAAIAKDKGIALNSHINISELPTYASNTPKKPMPVLQESKSNYNLG